MKNQILAYASLIVGSITLVLVIVGIGYNLPTFLLISHIALWVVPSIAGICLVYMGAIRLFNDITNAQDKRLTLAEKRLALTHTQERHQSEQQGYQLTLSIQAQRFELTKYHVHADAKGHYPYIPGESGYMALPNVNLKRIAAATTTTVSEDTSEQVTPLPTRVSYDAIRSQVPRGHTLLGISENGIETREFSILSTCWIVGGSKSGKSNTVALKVNEAYSMGCWFCVIDPHRYKQDSLYNSIRGYSDRFLEPGVATSPEDTLAVLKSFLAEAQARLSGQSKNRRPIILLVDEIGHVCDTVGLAGDELLLAQETLALLKKISRMCGQELRGFNMFGWFISQTATQIAWLRRNAMTVIAHKVLMMNERKLACNEDTAIARSMDTWPIGRVLIYGLDFPDGYLICQMAQFTPRIVDADREPTAFPQSEQKRDGVSLDETSSQAERDNIVNLFPVSVSEDAEDAPSTKKKDSGVSDETKKVILRMHQAGKTMREIAKTVGLTGNNYSVFQAACIELGIKKVEQA